jgi:TonB-linked SusC/RagA family outer membrane protein
MRKFLQASILFFMLAATAWAQERTVSGKVTSQEDGSALPGVNVVLKGTTVGTVTDVEGVFRLSVPPSGGALVFSFIGLQTQEVVIGNRTTVDVQLSLDVVQLGEVIVTAAGIQREKKALGYSVENVTGNKLQQVSEPDPLRALSGKVPGVNIIGSSGAPGSSTRITIRGNSSLLGNNQPLFVVDGIPYNNDLNSTDASGGLTGGGGFSSRISDLDPNDIASITVLKGAAAAALYGTRAASGVIVVTTKSGSASASKKGLEVTFSSTYGFEEIANIPDFQNTYGTGVNFAYAQANGSWGAPFIGTRPYASLDSINHWYNGCPGMQAFNGKRVPYRAYPNNVKDFFERGTIFENSVSLNGGNEKSVFSVTLSQLKQTGFVPQTEFQRHNISIGGKTELTNGLVVNANLAVTRSVQDGVLSGTASATQGDPSAFARTLYFGRNWDVQGQPFQNPLDLGSEFFIGRGNANNPYWAVENTGIRGNTDRYVATLGLVYDVKEWLSLSYKIGFNTYNQLQKEFQRPNGAGVPLGVVTELNVKNDELNSDFIATVTKDVSENFNIRALGGFNINQRTNISQAVQGTGYVVFDIDDVDNTNSVVPFGGGFSRRRIMGVYGDVSLGYKNWAFLNLTARNDWSSTLPVENRSFFYPAVNASVILSEALGIDSKSVNQIKVRAGWAQVGNDTNPYLLNNTFGINSTLGIAGATAGKPFTPPGGNPVPGASLNNVATDPNLKPERTTEFETGLDVRFLDNRVGISATYYDKLSEDQIAPVTLPQESGFSSLLTNFGSVTNKGIELSADITPVRLSNGLTWTVSGAFTHNKNKIKELRNGVNEIQFGFGFAGSVIAVHRPGEEYGQLLGTVNDRDSEGNFLIDPSNGQMIRGLNRQIIGNPNPDYTLGITNQINFKGFTLSALFDIRKGGDIFSNTVNSILGRGVLAYQADREVNRIIKGVYGNPNTHLPYLDDQGNTIPNQTMVEVNSLFFGESFGVNSADEWAVFDATTYRLREASLTYTLPKSLLEKTPFGSVSVGFTGRNLWFSAPNFPKDLNYDPETNQFGNTNQQGIEYSTTPSARRYAFTLRVSL